MDIKLPEDIVTRPDHVLRPVIVKSAIREDTQKIHDLAGEIYDLSQILEFLLPQDDESRSRIAREVIEMITSRTSEIDHMTFIGVGTRLAPVDKPVREISGCPFNDGCSIVDCHDEGRCLEGEQ